MTDQPAVESRSQSSQPPAPPPATGGRRRGKVVALIVLVGLALTGYYVWTRFFAAPRVPENIVTLSGRIEGDDSAVAPKAGGRILEIRFREGDSVNAGDTLAILDDQQVRAREDQARAMVLEAEAKAKAARDQISVLQEQLRQNRLQADQAKVDAEGRVRQAAADLAAAEADLVQQETAYQLAAFDKEAYTRLARTG